jgi:hypothetical protein
MRSQESKRLIKQGDTLLCWCVSHKEYLPCDQFYIRDRTSTGYDYNCSTCIKEQSKKNRAKKNTIPKVSERELSNNLLTRLGYDLESDLTVHEQFIQKYHDRIRT